MVNPKILVTTAAGKTGRAVTLQLLEKGWPVRALVRQADARAEYLRAAGAEVLIGSLEDLKDLTAAMAGVSRAYFCPPLDPGVLRRAALFAQVAEAQRLEVVVHLSQWVAGPDHPSVHAREKWLAARVFEQASGFDSIKIEPGWFADNYFAALGPIAQLGVMGLPLGQGLNAPPSNEDIARVITACIVDPRPHVGKAYRPTGPRLLEPGEIASALGQALSRRVRYQNVPLPLFLKVAKTLGVSDYTTAQLYWFLKDYQANAFGIGAPTSAVFDLAGVAPEPFDAIARRYVAASPAARRSLSGWFREAMSLPEALLARQVDLEAIETRYGTPAIAHARLAAESADWLRTHDPDRTEGTA
jgi:NAD(P)H dehydrogenase (quinone)